MARVKDQILPDFATDFLGNEIKEGDIVVYPTGGRGVARMVVARVLKVRDCRDAFERHMQMYFDYVTQVRYTAVRYHGPGHDGYRGPAAFKILVNRQKDRTWHIDGEKKVTVDQLHRVVSISAIERKAQATYVIEVGDDLPEGATYGPGWPD